MLKVTNLSWSQIGVSGVCSDGQRLGEFSETLGGVMRKGTHLVEETSYMLLRVSLLIVELLKLRDLVCVSPMFLWNLNYVLMLTNILN